MKFYCKFIFEYKNSKICSIIENALRIDNYQFVKTKVKGKKLISEISSDSIPSLYHTIEDYLECLSIAEKIAALV